MREFEWDDANVDHIAAHDVEPEEAEEALDDPMRVALSAYNTPSERRRAIAGSTLDGRLLYVVYTPRRGRLRVVTARDASEAERRSYRRRSRR